MTPDYWYGVGIVVALSLLLSLISVSRDAKVTSPYSIIGWPWLYYFLVQAIGYLATSLVASAIVPHLKIFGESLPGSTFAWSAFLGVFGFEVLLKHINVTIAGKKALTVDYWISSSLELATSHAIETDASRKRDVAIAHAAIIASKIPLQELNSYVLSSLGNGAVNDLEQKATQNNASSASVKALALAEASPILVASLVKQYKK